MASLICCLMLLLSHQNVNPTENPDKTLQSFPWIFPQLEQLPNAAKLAKKGLQPPEASVSVAGSKQRAAEGSSGTRSTCVESGGGGGGGTNPTGPTGPKIDPLKKKTRVIIKITIPMKK